MTPEYIYLNKHDLYIRLLNHDLNLQNKQIVAMCHALSSHCTTEREFKKAKNLLDKLDGVVNKKIINRSVYGRGFSITNFNY